MLSEIKISLIGRIIYPENRGFLYEEIAKLIKIEMPNNEKVYSAAEIDALK